jgi:hypothetical protein
MTPRAESQTIAMEDGIVHCEVLEMDGALKGWRQMPGERLGEVLAGL